MVDPSSRQTSGSAKPRVTRGNEVADKGRSIARKALAVNVYLVCNSNEHGKC